MKKSCQILSWSIGFNRYMVECEFWSMTTDKAVIVVLIDTQWNVNTAFCITIAGLMPVLIDTQWNVNLQRTKQTGAGIFVLIDTQWNVNWRKDWSAVSDMPGFNRHMVECGLWTFYIVLSLSYVLIDTQWNDNKENIIKIKGGK